LVGVGLHGGRVVHLTLCPAPPGSGICFVRTDLPHRPRIPAQLEYVVSGKYATVLGQDGAVVSTVEHLLGALWAMGVDNAVVELDGPEVPIGDGSALPFVEMIRRAGLCEQPYPRNPLEILEPLEVRRGGAEISLLPSGELEMTCTIHFERHPLAIQSRYLRLSPETFSREIAPARTFAPLEEVEVLRRHGLAQGGSLENAVVFDHRGVLNVGGLRFPDEPVRHKMLDLLGDLALLGRPLRGHLLAYRCGHELNHQLVRLLASTPGGC